MPRPHFALTFCLLLLPATIAGAAEVVFTPSNSSINGSVSYAALGRYKAEFERYRGVLHYDSKSGRVESVNLVIKAVTLKSNCPLCDKAARSAKLLNVKKFPDITFKDRRITNSSKGYFVDGMLGIHGVELPIRFPFEQKRIVTSQGRKLWRVSGSWDIPRKKFGIIWSDLLDHGGLVVGDEITVRWHVDIPEG